MAELERLLDRLGEVEDGGRLAVDVEDADDRFVVTADLPGFDREDIEVELRENTLRIEAEHEEAREERETTYVRREREQRSTSRSVSLPEEVDEGEASATFENGVLTVTLPKVHASEESTSVDIE